MDNAKHIELALRAGLVAKASLELTGVRSPTVLKLMAQRLVEEVNSLLELVRAVSVGKGAKET